MFNNPLLCVHISARALGISIPNVSFWEGYACYCKDGNGLWNWEGSKWLICARDSKILSRIFPGEASALKIAVCSIALWYIVFRSLGQHHVNAQASTREGNNNLVSDIRFKRLHFPLVHLCGKQQFNWTLQEYQCSRKKSTLTV